MYLARPESQPVDLFCLVPITSGAAMRISLRAGAALVLPCRQDLERYHPEAFVSGKNARALVACTEQFGYRIGYTGAVAIGAISRALRGASNVSPCCPARHRVKTTLQSRLHLLSPPVCSHGAWHRPMGAARPSGPARGSTTSDLVRAAFHAEWTLAMPAARLGRQQSTPSRPPVTAC